MYKLTFWLMFFAFYVLMFWYFLPAGILPPDEYTYSVRVIISHVSMSIFGGFFYLLFWLADKSGYLGR